MTTYHVQEGPEVHTSHPFVVLGRTDKHVFYTGIRCTTYQEAADTAADLTRQAREEDQ